MNFPQDKIYQFHVANLRAVEAGLERVSRTLRHAVASEDEHAIQTDLRLYALLLAMWGECRLWKLLYEPAFSDADRALYRAESGHLEKWKKVVEIAFRQHYGVPRASLSTVTLPHSAFARYTALIDLLSDELSAIITLRNKLAHGQWIYTFNEQGESIAQAQMAALRNENALTIQLKRGLIQYLIDTIHDLKVSKKTFERDFDEHFRAIEQLRTQLTKKSYDKYAEKMTSRLKRGQVKRRPPS